MASSNADFHFFDVPAPSSKSLEALACALTCALRACACVAFASPACMRSPLSLLASLSSLLMSSLMCCQVASLGQVAFVPRLALRQAGRRPGALVSSLDACLALGGFALFSGGGQN